MRVGVIGASGRVGGLVANELIARGHEVTAIVRDKSKIAGMPVIEKEIKDLTKEDLQIFDVVVNAFGVWSNDLYYLYSVTAEHLCNALSGTDTRLIIVGGAGSLYTDESHTTQAYKTEGFPKEYLPVATAAAKALSEVRLRNDVKWTYFSPAGFFDADGEKTGSYKLGGEELILNSKGESYISYADYSLALADEVENGKYVQKRFTAVAG